MAKVRVNKKEKRRLYQKQQFSTATQVRLMCEQMRSQAELDTFLLMQPDVKKRERMFEFVRPFLKFPNPVLPSTILRPSGIIAP